jgi:hypothetical protein
VRVARTYPVSSIMNSQAGIDAAGAIRAVMPAMELNVQRSCQIRKWRKRA